MSKPDPTAASIRELLASERFIAIWNMLGSTSEGERTSALSLVNRELVKRNISFLDISAFLRNPTALPPVERIVEKVVEKEVMRNNVFSITGFITVLEDIDLVGSEGNPAQKRLLKVRCGTSAYKIEPLYVTRPEVIETMLKVHHQPIMTRILVMIDKTMRSQGAPVYTIDMIEVQR